MLMREYEDRSPTASGLFRRRMRVRIFNAKFSPNLGDGLLSECVEKVLIEEGSSPDTWSIDLAARAAYGDVLAGRAILMSITHRLPTSVRQKALMIPLWITAARKWRPHYALGLRDADCVVIGGGNLFADFDLNFPIKLSLALGEATQRDLPVVIYGVGVGNAWSHRGLAMVRTALHAATLRAVFVRDLESKRTWDRLFAESARRQATVTRDPGLLASECFPQPLREAVARRCAGIGIISPLAIRYHSDEPAPTTEFLNEWYVELARSLIATGHAVKIFSNGSPEDRAYMDSLRGRFARLGPHLSFVDQCTPEELCAHIAHCHVLVAHRMHAIIAAYSYGVPAVALAWDRKLKSFMESVGRERYLCNVLQTAARDCAQLAARASAEGIDKAEHQQVLAEARDGIALLYISLTRGTAFAETGREQCGT